MSHHESDNSHGKVGRPPIGDEFEILGLYACRIDQGHRVSEVSRGGLTLYRYIRQPDGKFELVAYRHLEGETLASRRRHLLQEMQRRVSMAPHETSEPWFMGKGYFNVGEPQMPKGLIPERKVKAGRPRKMR